jgi:uncharacterized membrane protein YgcG
MVKDIEELLKLIVVLAVVIIGVFVVIYLLKGDSVVQFFRDAWKTSTNYWNATQLPTATSQPGANLAGFDGQGNPIYSSAVSGGGFGGGGGGAF